MYKEKIYTCAFFWIILIPITTIGIILLASTLSFLLYKSGFLSENAYWGLSSIMIALISIAYQLRNKIFQKSILDFQKSVLTTATSLPGEQYDILRIIAQFGKIELDKISQKLGMEKSEVNLHLKELADKKLIRLRKEKNKKYYRLELK